MSSKIDTEDTSTENFLFIAPILNYKPHSISVPSLNDHEHSPTLVSTRTTDFCLPAPPPFPDPLQAGWKGQSVCKVLEDNDRVRVLKCTFPPGVGHERHYHAAHFGYTLHGSRFRITDTTGTREIDVPTGSSFYNEEIPWHEVLNIGDSTAVFLIMEPK